MKKYNLIWLFLMALVLCACSEDENWFYHSVDFNGTIEDSKMVVTGTLYAEERPKIYVNQSYFFMDRLAMDSIEVIYTNGRGEEVSMYHKINRRGYLENADVEMQVNQGAWEKLRAEKAWTQESLNFSIPYSVPVVYYTCDRILHARDEVNIRVSHAKFPTATVEQKIPDIPVAKVEHLSLGDDMSKFDLVLSPYLGSESDVLCVSATYYGTHEENMRLEQWNPMTNQYVTLGDTTYYDSMVESVIYSQDVDCALYGDINKSLSRGYYGSSIGLFLPIYKSGKTMSLLSSGIKEEEHYYGHSDYLKIYADSLVLDVMTMSREAYLNVSSLVAGGYIYSNYISDPFSEGGASDIVGNITEIFDEMGMMENIQVYDNVDGAIGHVGAVARERIVLYRRQTP